jgi:hypothetical protein
MPGVFDGGKGAVPLVQVQQAPVDARRPQRPDASHPQQQLLADAHPLVAVIQACRQLPVLGRVLGHVGVQQQQRRTTDADLPDLGVQLLAGQRHVDQQRIPVAGS